jgi:WD40 repeat protein
VKFSADGKQVITVSEDGFFRAWQVDEFPNASTSVSEKIGDDGDGVAAISEDGLRCVWSRHTPPEAPCEVQVLTLTRQARIELKRLLVGPKRLQIEQLAISPDHRWVAAVGVSKLVLWDLNKPDGFTSLDRGSFDTLRLGNRKLFSAVAFSPDSKSLLTGLGTGEVKVWKILEGEPTLLSTTIKGHKDEISSIRFSPDGRRLVLGSYDTSGSIRGWPIDGREPMWLVGHTGWVSDLAVTRDGSQLFTSSWDHSVRRWTFAEDSFQTENVEGHTSDITAIAFSPNGEVVATAELSAPNIVLWKKSSSGYAVQRRLRGGRPTVQSLCFLNDGGVLVATDSLSIRSWNLENDDEWPNVKVQEGQFRASIVHSHQPFLYAASTRADIRLLAFLKTGPKTISRRRIPDVYPGTLTMSPNGETVSLADDEKVVFLDPKSLEVRRTVSVLGSECILAQCFSGDGKLLAVGDRDGAVRLVVVQSGQVQQTLSGSSDPVTFVAFVDGDETLVARSKGRKVCLWDVATARKIDEWPVGLNCGIALTPDRRSLAIGDETGVVRILPVVPLKDEHP